VSGGVCTADYCEPAAAVVALPTEAWFHLAATCDEQRLTFFVNGNALYSTPSPGVLKQTTTPLYLGCDFDSPGGYLHGRLDDIRIYNRALAPEQIARLYQAEKVHPRLGIARTAQPERPVEIRLDLLLEIAQTYQLETSHDLSRWAPFESPFTARTPRASRDLDAVDSQRFWRLKAVP